MDRSKNLIFIKGIDKTGEVETCDWNSTIKRYDVTFRNGDGKQYPYNSSSIEWVKNPKILKPQSVRIIHAGKELSGISTISIFSASDTDYWHFRFSNNYERLYNCNDLEISHSCLSEDETQICMNYLRDIASIYKLPDEDKETLLQKRYEKLGFIGAETAMAVYMNPKKHEIKSFDRRSFIFPFGGNSSQFKAVTNALTNQISVIQGPPGTGKTQTILNIIANLLIMGKNVQIVSNNNSATLNVYEKLSDVSYNLGFLVATLGKNDNKKDFIDNQSELYPILTDWKLETERKSELKVKIQMNTQELSEAFSAQERLAQARIELSALELEIRYFELYCNEAGLTYPDERFINTRNTDRIMHLWLQCNEYSEKERVIALWFKIKSIFLYGIFDWALYRYDLSTIIIATQNRYYRLKQSELIKEIANLEAFLLKTNAEEKMKELKERSLRYLHAVLFERYGGKQERKRFSEDDLWKNADEIVKEYPIVLSTTFSSRSSLRGVTYDYLIMDEASQVDIATGALALSCAKNAVIVGDLKQLPNVVKDDMKKKCDAIFGLYNLAKGYSFSENSFLRSICRILDDVPQTLLREHYRCHPKIIGFCNQKFYENELIVMTEDCGEPDALTVFKTVIGNHKRERINQRQIDVTIRDALPMLDRVNPQEIGIIAPYRAQVEVITKQLGNTPIEVDTVHKFQGREKETILLTTVDDVVTEFSDNPYLLNVAISRAKKQLILVISGNEQPKDSNISDLISYVDYNSFKVVHSEIRSVFDLLYCQYTDARIAFLKKYPRISAYTSENLMYCEIIRILKRYPSLPLNVICHQPLKMLIRNTAALSDDEYRYAMNPATHLDFLLYNKISKKAILAIEVDGFHCHKPGTEQQKRDEMKNNILEKFKIPLLRFPTNGSEECVKIDCFLKNIV